jgi:WD40 repeat protein
MKHEKVEALAFRPDGKVLATGGGTPLAGSHRLWDAATREPIGEPVRHQGEVRMVAFSPDGTALLTACNDKTAKLWGPDGRLLWSVGHQAGVHTAVFRGDGKAVLTASSDRTARLWGAADGKPLGPPLLHPAPVMSAVFSPDGGTVLTGCEDGAGRLWDAETGKPLGPPLTHGDLVLFTAFRPDGRTVFTAAADGLVRLWPVPRPWDDSPGAINLWIEVTTGLTLDRGHGVVVTLGAEDWRRRRDELAAQRR